MAEPLMPQTVAEQLQEMNTHQVRFINKVAPYNSGERAWFPAQIAAQYVIQGVAQPLECKDGSTGEVLGKWNLAPHQMVVATQYAAMQEHQGGDYSEIAKAAAEQSKEELVKVNQDDVNTEEAAEAGTFAHGAQPDEEAMPTLTIPPTEIAQQAANDPVEQPAPKAKAKPKK